MEQSARRSFAATTLRHLATTTDRPPPSTSMAAAIAIPAAGQLRSGPPPGLAAATNLQNQSPPSHALPPCSPLTPHPRNISTPTDTPVPQLTAPPQVVPRPSPSISSCTIAQTSPRAVCSLDTPGDSTRSRASKPASKAALYRRRASGPSIHAVSIKVGPRTLALHPFTSCAVLSWGAASPARVGERSCPIPPLPHSLLRPAVPALQPSRQAAVLLHHSCVLASACNQHIGG